MPRRAKRRPFWISKHFTYQALTTGNNEIEVASSSQLQLYSEDPTIIRMVGRLNLFAQRTGGGFEESTRSDAYLGLYCAHEDLPFQNPGNQDLDDGIWMWTGFMYAHSTFIQAPSRQFDSNTIIGGSTESRATQHIPNTFENIEFDIRSMRKAPSPCQLILALSVSERLPQTGSLHKLSGLIRVLVKE